MGISQLQKQLRAAASARNKARWGRRNEQGGVICKLADGKVRHLTPCPIFFCAGIALEQPSSSDGGGAPSASSGAGLALCAIVCVTMSSGCVCACARVVFCSDFVRMKCGSMLVLHVVVNRSQSFSWLCTISRCVCVCVVMY